MRHADQNAARTHWGSTKRCRSISLTDEAWDLLSSYAQANDLNRSEVLERLIRRINARPT